MRKLKLKVDELGVESFAADRDGGADGKTAVGTVEARELAPTLLNLCTAMRGLCPCTPRMGEL